MLGKASAGNILVNFEITSLSSYVAYSPAHDDQDYDHHIYDTKGKYGSSSDRVTSAGVGEFSREAEMRWKGEKEQKEAF